MESISENNNTIFLSWPLPNFNWFKFLHVEVNIDLNSFIFNLKAIYDLFVEDLYIMRHNRHKMNMGSYYDSSVHNSQYEKANFCN
jgi:hypothetical protein